MNESICVKAVTDGTNFYQAFKHVVNGNYATLHTIYGNDIFDPLRYTIDFDQVILEVPDSYKDFLQTYLELYSTFKNLMEKIKEKEVVLFGTVAAFNCINQIIEHLKGLLNPENEVHKQPKQDKIIPIPPEDQTVLNRKQSALLFWYLRECKIISKSVQTQNLAILIEQMTGYKYTAQQIQDVLRSTGTDPQKLGKGSDKVNRNDFVIIVSKLKELINQIETDYTKLDNK